MLISEGKIRISQITFHVPRGDCKYEDRLLSLNFLLGWRMPACKVDHQLCSQGTVFKNSLLPSVTRDFWWREAVIFSRALMESQSLWSYCALYGKFRHEV